MINFYKNKKREALASVNFIKKCFFKNVPKYTEMVFLSKDVLFSTLYLLEKE